MVELLILFFPSLGEALPHCNTTDCDMFIAELKCVTKMNVPYMLKKTNWYTFFASVECPFSVYSSANKS